MFLIIILFLQITRIGRIPVRVNVPLSGNQIGSHIWHKYFSPLSKCLGNLESCVFQRRCRLQYVLYDMLNEYFIALMAENTCTSILHWKKVKTGILDYLSPGDIKLKIGNLFFQAHIYHFPHRNESCWE